VITRTDLQRDPNDLTGQQCGGSYINQRLLGAGGMGQVCLARASELDGKEAAVKVLSGNASRNLSIWRDSRPRFAPWISRAPESPVWLGYAAGAAP